MELIIVQYLSLSHRDVWTPMFAKGFQTAAMKVLFFCVEVKAFWMLGKYEVIISLLTTAKFI